MKKEIPILYSTPMIKAKLAGRKNQTRRIMKIQPDNECYFQMRVTDVIAGFGCIIDYNQGHENPFIRCPYGKPGDLLYARETFCRDQENDGQFLYRATEPDAWDEGCDGSPWKPSIHMPKVAARIWDRVVSIRVERVQDISEEDAIAEGIEPDPTGIESDGVSEWMNYKNYLHVPGKPETGYKFINAVESYRSLWIKINGPESWEANPWVWVITTENVSLTGKPNGTTVGRDRQALAGDKAAEPEND